MSETSIQLILDPDALAGYGTNEAVGELLTEVEDEDLLIAVSRGSLAQAIGAGANRALVELLLQRDSVVQISPMADWDELGRFLALVDGARHDVHDAWLVMLALKERAHIVTSHPDRYTAIHKSVLCIPLDQPWT